MASAEFKNCSEYTVTELKELLRAEGLNTTGNKAALIARLIESDPAKWNPDSNRDYKNPDVPMIHYDHKEGLSSTKNECDITALQEDTHDFVDREFEMMRRDRDLLRREIDLMRREREMSNDLRNSGRNSNVNDSGSGDVRAVKDLLSEFDGTDNSFWRWKQQVELLRATYRFDDNAMKILISSKLKGRALNWFHSKPSHLSMATTDLLNDMQQMFDLRPSRLTLRREFERRIWQSNENFSEYYHDKVILANRVPIDETEMVDYIIEGVPDARLRDQARIQCFREKSELMKAFEKITLRTTIPKSSERDQKQRREWKQPRSTREEESSTKAYNIRCYNCQAAGHLSSECEKPKERGNCFRCGGADHIQKDCPNKDQRRADTGTNVIQSRNDASIPYMLPVQYTVVDDDGSSCVFSLMALLDTGSPISIIKNSFVPEKFRVPIETDYNYHGVNGSKLDVLGTFCTDVEVSKIGMNINFYVVPDNTMSCAALLGRDFISRPGINIKLGEKVEMAKSSCAQAESSNFVQQIMNINVASEMSESENLNIGNGIDNETVRLVKDIYENTYATKSDAKGTECETEMVIRLKHEQPISFRPRRLAFAEKEKLRIILDDLVKDGVIRPSNSPYASPIVLVRKKNGDIRLCVDFRELNKITIKDNFPTPLIDDYLDRLRHKNIFSSLDLKSGFHHVKMAQSSVQYTSFVTPMGQYEYLRMPFGLTNAPRVFQRYINDIFKPLIERNKVLIYMDDILVATDNVAEHLEILREIFEIAQQNNLQFRLDKCSLLYSKITYLGYTINKDGICPSAANVESVVDYPTPKNTKEVQRFIGLASYFRRFIPGFSLLAKPLYDLLKKGVEFIYGVKENDAFELLKRRLSDSPVLAIYSPKAITELHCDASAHGFGAILLQKQDNGLFQPVSYFSHRTSAAEARYHSFELECLATIYAIKRFHVYLFGIRFKIITDCDSFRLTLSKQNINPRISRWAMFLQQYDFEIEHRPGKRMTHVDALSRCHNILVLEANTFEQTLSIQQDRDEEICKIRDMLEIAEDKFFELRDGLVYRKNKDKKLLFCVPESMESNVIRSCHDDLGHLGVEKVVEAITRLYWFPSVREKVKNHIANCLKCIEFSPPSGKQQGYLHNIPKSNVPFSTIHVDHYGPLEKTNKGHKYILGVIDAFTKFIRLYACKATTAAECIDCLRDYFRAYSKPKRVISDRGTAFTSDAFKKFMIDESVVHVLIAPGTPRANGQIERFNKILTPMLSKLCDTPAKWDQITHIAEFAINNTICRSTGEVPSKLLFGVEQVGKISDHIRLFLDSVTKEARDLTAIRDTASVNIMKEQNASKLYYDRSRKPAVAFKPGDYVVIKNVDTTIGVNKKLIPKYKGPYVVNKVLDCDRYVISDIEGFQVTQILYSGTVAADQIKKWIPN